MNDTINNFCIIIGTKKAATTSLYEYIAQHPQVCRGKYSKEPNFFGDRRKWSKGLEWFKSQFEFSSKIHKYLLDATTDYTQEGFINVPLRMKDSGAVIKLIYIVRDPFKKIESQHHQFLIDRDTIRPISECLDIRITESAKYYKQANKYLQYFDMSDILFIEFEELKNNIDTVLKRITKHLGISDFNYNTSLRHNEKSSAVGQSFVWYKFLRNIFRKLNLTPLIPQTMKDKFRTSLGNLKVKSIKEEDFKLNKEQKDYLKKELIEDAKLFSDLTGVRVNHWSIFKDE